MKICFAPQNKTKMYISLIPSLGYKCDRITNLQTRVVRILKITEVELSI